MHHDHTLSLYRAVSFCLPFFLPFSLVFVAPNDAKSHQARAEAINRILQRRDVPSTSTPGRLEAVEHWMP